MPAQFNTQMAVLHQLACLLCATLLAATAACAPVRDSRGHILNERAIATIEPGTSTRATVLAALGSPSAVGTFQRNSWYYIGIRTEAVPYRAPAVLDQQVIAIEFTDIGIVANVQRYSLADATTINPVARETVTRGREMGIIEQLVGNIGRFNPRPGKQP